MRYSVGFCILFLILLTYYFGKWEGLTALGTIAVAIIAIWGDLIRNILIAPILILKLRDKRGNYTVTTQYKPLIFYHLIVHNESRSFPAKQVRVILTEIKRKISGSEFEKEPIISPLHLSWSPREVSEPYQNISEDRICDLGFLSQGENKFNLSVYWCPNNVRIYIGPEETMRIKLKIEGDNIRFGSPLILEIYWDGKWSINQQEMERHLNIKEVATY
jgi:hypothetical protein